MKGLYSGREGTYNILPSDTQQFVLLNQFRKTIPASINYLASDNRFTTSIHSVAMVEHLLSALYGTGVFKFSVELNQDEVPFSPNAYPFVNHGLNPTVYDPLVLKNRFKISDGDRYLIFEPCDQFEIDMLVSYQKPIGSQSYYFVWSPENYRDEISWSRTFYHEPITFKDYVGLRNTFQAWPRSMKDCPHIIYNHQNFMNLQQPGDREFARHKILDLIGDLALLGRPLLARLIAYKPGHKMNTNAVKHLREIFYGNI